MRKIATILSGAALLALGACGRDEDQAAGGSTGEQQTAEEVASEMKKVSLQPGEWETTSEIVDVTMENAPQGMPPGMMDAMKGRKTVAKTCISAAQAEKPDASFLTAQKDSNCSYSGFEMMGGAVKGNVTCTDPRGGTAHMTMQGIYTPATYTLNMEMNSAGMGGAGAADMAMHMKMKTTGKRIGDCTAAAQ